MPNLTEEQLNKLLRYGPFLDNVEAVLADHQAAMDSVALQRDAANIYAGFDAETAVTDTRVTQVFGALYLACRETSHTEYLKPLQDMLSDLGALPSLPVATGDKGKWL